VWGFSEVLVGTQSSSATDENIEQSLHYGQALEDLLVSFEATSEKSWTPPTDDQLSWFRADQKLFAAPRPLDYTLEIHALVFGLTYALESIEFPLYALRSRVLNGRVYLAAVPSAVAEGNLPQRLKNIHDQSLRFTRNIERAWDRQLKPEVELYNRRFEEIANFAGPSSELAERLRKLRRERGNQWFTAIRGVVAPTVLLQQRVGEVGREIGVLAEDLTRQALDLVADRGKGLIRLALNRVGERLVKAEVIDKAEDIFWIEWMEICELLQSSKDQRARVAERENQAARDADAPAPAILGPSLPPDAPRMYLLSEILKLLDR
jgi:hypothetical protein